jgi:hypothetical protein
MKPRDDRLYQESYFNEKDFRGNIDLENTKAERAEEIYAKRERKRQAYRMSTSLGFTGFTGIKTKGN